MLTVLMSMYNSATYLELAIRSTLAQSYKNFEFLIVDDGSTDNSLEIAKRYQKHHKRIRIIAHENRGACESLNDAAKRARGDWIFRMDPDDMMLPMRLERQVTFLRDNPDLSVASSPAVSDRRQRPHDRSQPLALYFAPGRPRHHRRSPAHRLPSSRHRDEKERLPRRRRISQAILAR